MRIHHHELLNDSQCIHNIDYYRCSLWLNGNGTFNFWNILFFSCHQELPSVTRLLANVGPYFLRLRLKKKAEHRF